jgi:CheY-like chemotaxis protein
LEGDYAVLEIVDQGVGISPEDLNRIFEPFYTRKVMGRSGTGLGMAVVWGTVQDHDGYIDVESTVGQGSTFRLYFPATRETLSRVEAPLPIQAYMGKGERILVVDDVKEQREIATSLLGRLNYSVETVESGMEAVEYIKRQPSDLVILDMIMDPGIDGLETYRRMLAIRPNQRAIIASGYSENHRVREAQRLGAGTYVRKPYMLEKIGIAVRRELDRPAA